MRERTLCSILLTGLLLLPAGALEAAQPAVLDGEIFTADTAHSLLDFTVRQVGFGRVRGTFKNYQAAIFYRDGDLTNSSVSVTVEVKSVDTGSNFRDNHLRSGDFFEVEKFPLMTFRSERIEKTADGYVLVGPLTIRDVTRGVRIPFQIVSLQATDQFDNQRIVFDGKLTLNRRDFGIVGPDFWNKLISDTVDIDISLAGRIFNYNNPFSKWKENSIGKVAEETVESAGLAAARGRVLDLWENHKEEYDFGLTELYWAGMKLAQKGRLEDAIGVLELTAELHGSSAEARDLTALYAALAEAYAKAGNHARALENTNKALSYDPESPKARELLRYLKS